MTPTMLPHFPFVVPEPSYLKFGTVAVLTATSAKYINKTLLQRMFRKVVVALVEYISANLYYCVQYSHPQTIF